ncbi:hypothetical protein AVDCRST_MAG92-1495, partial [uncultured Coleofasciculus sp.]
AGSSRSGSCCCTISWGNESGVF